MIVKVLCLTGLVFGAFSLESSGDTTSSTELNEKCESKADCDVAKDGTTFVNQTRLQAYVDSRLKLGETCSFFCRPMI